MSPLTRSKRRKQISEDEALGGSRIPRDAPVCMLHYELLAEVFQRVLFGGCSTSEADQEELVNLTLTCRRWRNVAINTPRFWSRIAFDLVGTRSEEEDIIRRCNIWFPRAKTLPLSVDIFLRQNTPSLMGPHFVPGDFHASKDNLWDYLSHLPRLNTMRLRAPNVSYIADWFAQPRNSYLKHIAIDVSPDPCKSLRLFHYAEVMNADTTAVDTITRRGWPGAHPNGLTVLSLHACVSSFFALCILEECPLLETCGLDLHPKYSLRWPNARRALAPLPNFVSGRPIAWAIARGHVEVVLPNLPELKLSNVSGHEEDGRDELAQLLRIPKLRKLQLSNYRADVGVSFETSLCGSRRTLQSLDLRHLEITDRALRNVLKSYLNLKALTLYRPDEVDGSLFDDL